ncbi:MAG: ribosome hibernation-promoting factor, HPF/YfiA family [Gemmatimonas sp.]
MTVSVTGKQLDVGDALRSHAEDALVALAAKYFDRVLDASAVFSRDAHLYCATLSVRVGHDLSFTATGEAADPYPAFDVAAERLDSQLRRHKRKLRDHHRAEGQRTIRE